MEIKIEKTITITDQDIDDIMVTALEGGINYHCVEVEVIDGDYKGSKYASGVISKGGSLLLIDEEDEQYNSALNKERFINGLTMFLKDNGHIIEEDGTIDCGNIDADDADLIIQYACFGEQIFG